MEKIIKKLEKKLLSLGGSVVLFNPHSLPFPESLTTIMLNHILKNGRAFEGAVKVEGAARECHHNCIEYLKIHEGKQVMGFAMTGAGHWHFHSWVWDGEKILETTPVERLKYFGAPFELGTCAKIKIC